KIPIIVGCDFKVWKYIALTPYFKFSGYLNEKFVDDAGIEGPPIIYADQEKENFNNWRGYAHFGINLSIPISIPRQSDADGDGVPDKFDFCSGTLPGTRVDERGCPLISTEVPSYKEIEKELLEKGAFVTNNIYFAFDRANILQESSTILSYLGKILENHKDWKIEIQGHTDSLGSSSYNSKLSRQRANSVKNYFAHNYNINTKNLSTKGFGESIPIADNGKPEGRAINRRVEFRILK
ncbi:OmpA family protein, partial [bacterium]|nr:OmpA family protein [bacterium]